MAAIRYLTYEESLEMALRLRKAAELLEYIGKTVELGQDIKGGVGATDAMHALRRIRPEVVKVCEAVQQLREDILRPEPEPPSPAQYPLSDYEDGKY